jgi:hypothetical protein
VTGFRTSKRERAVVPRHAPPFFLGESIQGPEAIRLHNSQLPITRSQRVLWGPITQSRLLTWSHWQTSGQE